MIAGYDMNLVLVPPRYVLQAKVVHKHKARQHAESTVRPVWMRHYEDEIRSVEVGYAEAGLAGKLEFAAAAGSERETPEGRNRSSLSTSIYCESRLR